MATTMTVSEARAALPDLVRRVAAGDEVTITRHGRAVAVVVRPDALRSRRTDAVMAELAAVREVLARGRQTPLSEPSISPQRADELAAEVRRSRSGRR